MLVKHKYIFTATFFTVLYNRDASARLVQYFTPMPRTRLIGGQAPDLRESLISLEECSELCLQRKNCVAFNFDLDSICELLRQTQTDAVNMKTDDEYIYFEIIPTENSKFKNLFLYFFRAEVYFYKSSIDNSIRDFFVEWGGRSLKLTILTNDK